VPTILPFLALAANVSWFLMKEGQGIPFFAAVKTAVRLWHGELLKAEINRSRSFLGVICGQILHTLKDNPKCERYN
jgi:hypothetical protein